MRRFLLTTLLALPGLAAAQVLTAGQLITEPDYINIDACGSATATLTARWMITVTSGSFTTGGTFWVYASDTQWPSSGENANFCFERDTQDTAGNTIHAGQVTTIDNVNSTTRTQEPLNVAQILKAAGGAACDSSVEKIIYVCAHWVDANNKRLGYANGTVKLSLTRPGTPTITQVKPGEGSLSVSLSAGSSNIETFTYRVIATADGKTTRQAEGTSPVKVSGLENGVLYNLAAYALSQAKNPSVDFAASSGTPVPVDDFWDHYSDPHGANGAEQGGCSAGAGGALALLAAAALTLLRRRNA